MHYTEYIRALMAIPFGLSPDPCITFIIDLNVNYVGVATDRAIPALIRRRGFHRSLLPHDDFRDSESNRTTPFAIFVTICHKFHVGFYRVKSSSKKNLPFFQSQIHPSEYCLAHTRLWNNIEGHLPPRHHRPTVWRPVVLYRSGM